jgi:hypothetical protein
MMRIKLVNITDRGLPNQERLHLSVFAPANLVNYVVFESATIFPFKVKTPPDRAYWFPNMQVFPGDQVVLYTGLGVNKVERQPDGKWNRFFYWGLGNTIWDDRNTCAVLLEINQWDTKF